MKSFPKKSLLIIQNPIQKLLGTLEYDGTMKVRIREGVMRKRPPNLKLVLFLTLMIILPRTANGSRCGYDELYQCNKSDCGCVKCLNCPPGQGLSPQCGSNKNVTMKCLPCENGKTYSKHDDFESCHPCHKCYGQETLQKCNSTHNAVCKEGCMAGHKWDEFFHMCTEVKKNPTNPRKSTTTKPSTELPSIIVAKRINDSIYDASGPNEGVNKTTQSVPTSVKPPNVPQQHSWMSKTEIAVVGIITFALIVVGYYWKRKNIERFLGRLYCSCTGRSQPDQQDPIENAPMNPDAAEDVELNEIRVDHTDGGGGDIEERNPGPSGQQGGSPGGSTEASRADHHYPQPGQGLEKAVISDHSGSRGLDVEKAIAMLDVPDQLYDGLLRDLPSELKDKVAVKISKKELRGWKEIARFLKAADDDELESIETNCSYGESKLPGKQLFTILEASFPRLTVKKFIEALEYVKRKDVIDCIHCGLREMYGQPVNT